MIRPSRVPVIHVDTRRLRERIDVARRSGDNGREEAARVMASAFLDVVYAAWPRDTNRSLNGWIEAARDVNATTKTPLPIRESRNRKMILDVLEKQLARLERKVEQLETVLDRWYYARGRTGPWLRKKETELRRLKKRRDRAAEELAKFLGAEGALGIDLFRRKGAKTQRLATVRTKVYGGVGAVLRSGDRAFIRLHNLEPHSGFVERRTRVVARAMAQLRRAGLRRAGRAYLERQAVKGGLRVGRGAVSGSRGLPGLRE